MDETVRFLGERDGGGWLGVDETRSGGERDGGGWLGVDETRSGAERDGGGGLGVDETERWRVDERAGEQRAEYNKDGGSLRRIRGGTKVMLGRSRWRTHYKTCLEKIA